MNQPGVQRHAIQKGLEGRARGTQRADHVDMAEAPGIVDVNRTEVGAHRHGLFLDHQNRRRRVLRQSRAPTEQQILQAPLQGGVDSGANQRRAVGAVQAPGEQRRKARFLTRRQEQRFFQCLIDR